MKFYLSILLCLVCLSCANQADQYIIRGSFPGLQDGMTVRLLNAETRNKDEQLLAADTVKNGRFELTGSVDAPVMCHLWISNKDIVSNKKQSRSLGTRLFLDHSAIKIRTPFRQPILYQRVRPRRPGTADGSSGRHSPKRLHGLPADRTCQ